MNKRGLSTIVATVLILLITIVVAGIIATVVVPFTRNNLDSSTECLSYKDYFQFQQSSEYNGNSYNFNCVQQSGGNNLYGLTVKTSNANLSGNVKSLGIVFVNANSQQVTVTDGQESSSSENGIKLFAYSSAMKIPKEGEFYTYTFNAGSQTFTKAQIYPILNSGRKCPQTDEIPFVTCGSGVLLS